MDNKIWLSMPPRKFGNDVIVGALSAPQAYQCKITKSTGMPTQMQHEVFWREIASPPLPPTIWREKQQQRQSRFRLNCNVFTDVENRERAKVLDKNKGAELRW